MKDIKTLISIKQDTLKSLEQEKHHLQHIMANPTSINNNEQKIEDTRRSVNLLKYAEALSDDKGDSDASTKKKLEDLNKDLKMYKKEAEDIQDDSYVTGDKKVLKGLIRDVRIITDIINKDIVDNEADKSSSQESSSNVPKETTSTDIIDDSMPDYSSFDDF